jgi:hypothetical protein
MERATLLKFDSEGAAYRAFASGEIRSIFHTSPERDFARIREMADRSGITGTHGVV